MKSPCPPAKRLEPQLSVSDISASGLSLMVYVGLILSSGAATAQIIPDNTLGTESSTVTSNVQVQGALGERIDGGVSRASTLFHSFESFNVGDRQRVYFANPVGIETILSRVTGSDGSDILGTLGVDGQASLFLLNPNGFVFGENARLDVRGSFMATTAEGFTLPDGNVFSAVDPTAPPLLTMAITPGLQYGASPGVITNQADLSVGRNLTLAAGSITSSGNLSADSGYLRLEAVTGELAITNSQLNAAQDMTIQALGPVTINNTGVGTDGTLRVQSDNAITISGSDLKSGRDMVFRAPIRQLANSANDNTYTTSGYFVTENANGDIVDFLYQHHPNVIRADGDVQIDADYNGGSLYILAGGAVTTAPGVRTIDINGNADGSITTALSDGQGNNQQITVTAGPQAMLDVRSGLDWSTIPGGMPGSTNTSRAVVTFGSGGNPAGMTDATIDLANNATVTIQNPAGNVYLSNQYQPNGGLAGNIVVNEVTTTAATRAGRVGLTSRDAIEVTGTINVSPSLQGEAGDLLLMANGDISLLPGVTLESAGTIGGDIDIISDQGNLVFNDNFIFSLSADTGDRADPVPGNLRLEAQSIFLNDSTRIANAAGLGRQPGGQIDVNAADAVRIITTSGDSDTRSTNPLINVFLDAFGGTGIVTASIGNASGGNLNVNTQELTIRNETAISDPRINDPANFLTGLSSATFPFFGDVGDAGAIRINADSITIDGNQPGEFFILDRRELAGRVVAIRTGITSASQGAGLAGNLIINTRELSLQEGAAITTGHVAPLDTIVRSTQAEDPREMVINASERISLTGKAAIATATISRGDSSDLTIHVAAAGQGLFLQDGALIAADTLITRFNPNGITAGAAGSIEIAAPTVQLTNNSRIGSASGNDGGVPGTIALTVNTLEVVNSLVSTSSENNVQTAGNIGVNATDSIRVSGSILDPIPDRLGGIAAEATLGGNAGTITINTPQLVIGEAGAILTSTSSGEGGSVQLQNIDTLTIANGELSASTQTGTAGSIRVNDGETAADQIVVQGADGLLAAAATGDGGTAGDVILNTQQLQALNGALVSTSNVSSDRRSTIQLSNVRTLTLNQGQLTTSTQDGVGGTIQLNRAETDLANVQLEDSQISTAASGSGDAGGITMRVRSLTLMDNAVISAATQSGQAGGITIAGRSLTLMDNATLSAATVSGQGGDILLEELASASLQDSTIAASTDSGVAGRVQLSATGVIQLDNSALSVEANAPSGRAGDMSLNTRALVLENNSRITVSSPQGQAGNIDVTANRLDLNTSTISAETGQDGGDGDNFATVTLAGLDLLLLNNGSLISAEANGEANGGNIVIEAPDGLITAPPLANNDIIATAVNGMGGNITLSALRFFGLQEAEGDRTTLRSNTTNDISASSDAGIDGTIMLRELAIDPSRGLAELPTTLINSAGLLEQDICQASSNSSFIAVGRGGLSATPTDLFTSDDIWSDQRLIAIEEEARAPHPEARDELVAVTPTNPPPIEAQGWIRDHQERVILFAHSHQGANRHHGQREPIPASHLQPMRVPFLSCRIGSAQQ